MGLISAMLGHVSEVDTAKLEEEFGRLLAGGEEIKKAYKLVRDLAVFTNLRLILVNKQGLTGKKREYLAIPYKHINYFNIETTGHFDIDAEIKIWVKGRNEPLSLEFKEDKYVYDVFRAISEEVLK